MNFAPSTSSFIDLGREHQVFMQIIASLEQLLQMEAMPAPEALCQFLAYVENVHHRKEEELLFPLLAHKADVNVGGPLCMTFFTPRVIGCEWKEAFRDLADFLGVQPPFTAKTAFQEEVFQSGCMLKIPLEDHLVGACAASLLNEPESALENKPLLLKKFLALLKDHIQREEECLFPLAERLLSQEEKYFYAEQAAMVDQELHSAATLQRILESLV